MKNARERMDILAAYREVGSYRGAALMCGTTHKTVKRVVQRAEAGEPPPVREPRPANFEGVRALVAASVKNADSGVPSPSTISMTVVPLPLRP